MPALVAKLNGTGLGELEVREGDWRIRVRRPVTGAAAPAPRRPERPRLGAASHAEPRGTKSAPRRRTPPGARRPPRRSSRRPPSASSGPAVAVGTRVRAGDRIAVVDLLGIPQDVVAPIDGTLVEVFAETGEAVEYGEEVAVVEAVAAPAPATDGTGALRPGRGGLTVVTRVLIANRGEIALRILRACRTLGIEAVVAYSEADRESLAPMLADEAICIGPADARRSYLSAPAIISAALVTGCDAIHPGYGFLSEDDAFADAVRAHDLTFIGPPSHVLERFASKEETRRLLAAHGLPTIPGSGLLRDEAQALEEAERVGYPVLVKPSAGGGGKGMRMVRSPRELAAVLPICRSEAQGRVRRRLAVPREVARGQPPRRDPGRGRPVRPRRPPLGARLLASSAGTRRSSRSARRRR